MPINSMESIFCVALFVVPGYITSVVKKRLCPTANVSDGVRVIRSITLSLSNFLLWFWLYGLILADCAPWEDVKAFLSFRGLLFILALFGTSAANGFLFAIVPGLLKGLKSLKLIKWIKSLKLIRWQTPYPTAWDYMIHTGLAEKYYFEIILKKDGIPIHGAFLKGSQVALDADGGFVDIYFKEILDLGTDNDAHWDWGGFIWISRNEIKYLRFTEKIKKKGGEQMNKENKFDSNSDGRHIHSRSLGSDLDSSKVDLNAYSRRTELRAESCGSLDPSEVDLNAYSRRPELRAGSSASYPLNQTNGQYRNKMPGGFIRCKTPDGNIHRFKLVPID